MAYMTNIQFNILEKMRTEIQNNSGHVSEETFAEFSELIEKIQADKTKLKEKSGEYIKEKRKMDKNYARKKN